MVEIPLERWEEMTSCFSADIAVEQDDYQTPVSVRTTQYNGWLYTSFGVVFGSIGHQSRPRLDAWKLVPLGMYTGETTTRYHDEDAIRAGTRSRGSLLGLIVSVRGKKNGLR